MRDLVILRGAPGSGKSTFLKENNLNIFTLCIDNLRSLFETPIMDHEKGKLKINQNNDMQVWNLLFDLLEKRMQNGEFTIIDACHSKATDFCKYYKLAEKYRYRLWCIDFSIVPIEICKKQNCMRESFKIVPETIIDNIYSRFNTTKIPSKFITVYPHNWKQIISYEPLDVNQYKKLIFIGDIHGCFDPLNKYFLENPYNMDNLYIFMGDYFDRGIQNKEVCQWLLNHYSFSNIMLLTGNHEKWFINYAEEEYKEDIKYISTKSNDNYIFKCKSKEFLLNTVPELENFSKKDLRKLSRKFIQCAYLTFNNYKFFCSHAGLGFFPKVLKFISTNEIIKGKKYEDDIDKWFEQNNTDSSLYQIHGHRNFYNYDINQFKHSINLNEPVEFGENLRIIEISK